MAITLIGGATRPWRRLLAARSHWAAPETPTTTARSIQLATGVIVPWTRS